MVIALPSHGIVFKIFNKGFIQNAEREYSFLKLLEKHEFPSPKPYYLLIINNFPILVREYIPGIHFSEFLDKAAPKEIIKVIRVLLENAYKLDSIGIFLDELSNPTKNIIVNNGYVFFIDFERAQELTGKKSNVTQFLSFLIRVGKSTGDLKNKLVAYINFDKILDAARKFKKKKQLDKLFMEIFE